jgi:hypothetical protein
MYLYNEDMRSKREELESRHQELTREVEAMGPWIVGTLVETTRFCGKQGCACHQGGDKHPVMFITWKESGKTICLYIPRKMESQVRIWSQNYKKMKQWIRKISRVREKIIRLRDD